MKKALIFCLILCIGFSTVQIKAATEDSGDGNTIVLDDGTIIRYNNNAIDGGIDLSGLEFHDNRAWFQLNNQNNKLTTLAILSVMLDVPFHSQINSVDCGLAAMQMMLGTVGYNYTQSELANYLKTTGGDELASVLTDLVSESKYAFSWEWYNYNPSTINNVKNHIVEALSYGNPVMANTFETAGEYYFKGHEEFGIQSHYGLIGDYYDYGSTFTYVNPAVGTSWSSKCVMNQTITLDDLCRALGEGGYVW